MRITKPTNSSSVDIENIDLLDTKLYGCGDPHLIWDAMRKRKPVHWQSVGNDGFWSITKYEDCLKVLKDYKAFTSQRGTMLSLLGVNDPAGRKQMAVSDPPIHTQLRIPIQKALSTKEVQKQKERTRIFIRKLLLPLSQGESYDFSEGMVQLSTAVSGMLMDLPSEDWNLLSRLTTSAIAPDDPEYIGVNGKQATMERAHRELFAYFHDIVTQRNRSHGDDIISQLINIQVDGRRIDLGTVVSNCFSLLLGANVTTPHVPSSALFEMIDSGIYEEWMKSNDTSETFLNEALRWSTPASHFMRYATEDIELSNQLIRSGDAVVVWLGSANRDEEIFTDPYKFDIRRKPNQHIAFGFGPHYCVGHIAARQTLQLLFDEIRINFNNFEIIKQPEHLHSNFVAGIKHMTIRSY